MYIHDRFSIYIPLRRPKVVILTFSDLFLIDNGSLADSPKKWPIPLILVYIMYLEMADSPKKWPIPRNQQEESATSKFPLLAI